MVEGFRLFRSSGCLLCRSSGCLGLYFLRSFGMLLIILELVCFGSGVSVCAWVSSGVRHEDRTLLGIFGVLHDDHATIPIIVILRRICIFCVVSFREPSSPQNQTISFFGAIVAPIKTTQNE